jgi:signal transduction histidine kinase
MRRGLWIYLSLATAWSVFVSWQVLEHRGVVEAARQTLMGRARAITTTLGLVIGSQRRGGGIVSQDRLQAALTDLTKSGDKSGELDSIVLLNREADVVISAGEPVDEDQIHAQSGVTWTADKMILRNPLDLGTNAFPESAGESTAIVLPFGPAGTNLPGILPPPSWMTNRTGMTNAAGLTNDSPRFRRRGPGRGPFGRPPWMTEADYAALMAKQGVHSFVIVMPTRSITEAASQDFFIRLLTCGLATISVLGAGLTWRSVQKSADLELRLVKASEMNSHLKQMNLAAAGLAHETRNPLNIIRGLAQLISRQEAAPADVRDRSRSILDETDRVTGQLNEFINFSRPREVRRSPVALERVATEVARALSIDAEEKGLKVSIAVESLVIEADEQLFRQTLFNLLLNAIQAADRGGEIRIVGARPVPNEIVLEVRDNGPGVPPEHRLEIFKPYFTTNADGTGLGLAVVRQIVLAHGWEIECAANEPRGAVFRIVHIRPAAD